jgi:uncharacterized protein (TIGR02145 family)
MKNFILIIYCFTFLIIPSVYSQKGRPGPKIVDIDGNSYKTVYIGKQHWMAENLKVSKYNDGTPIPNFYSKDEWWKERWSFLEPKVKNIGAWCFYDNNAANNAKFGKLYNWYAVGIIPNENKNVCPEGWHVPTSLEWDILIKLLDGPNEPEYVRNILISTRMQEIGSWEEPRIKKYKITNESLFSARPGGFRAADASDFQRFGEIGSWWSSSIVSSDSPLSFTLWPRISIRVDNGGNTKEVGCSVRCLKD